MRQLQELGLRTCPPQLFDDAEADTAAAMNGDAGRLVDDQHCIILEHHGKVTGRRRRLVAAVHCARRHADRRHPDLIAQLQAVIRPDPTLVYPHLAAAQNAINVTIRHALAHFQEEIVDSLSGGILPDFKPAHRVFA